MKNSPCLDCPERHEKCWSKCEKYKTWRREYDAGKREADKQTQTRAALDAVKRYGIKRAKRYNKKK